MIRKWWSMRAFMREHTWTHAHLSEYVDGELPPDEAARIERHTSLCPQCTKVLVTLRQTLRNLRDLRGEAPEGLADGIVGRLRSQG